jgi:hypothetical protein
VTRSPPFTRRRLLGLLGATAALPLPAIGAPPGPHDRGIGGTGYAPETASGDRGIGGTGFIGTIQRFGSIIVNDARIAYPAGVPVRIDGRASSSRQLKIGHVVRVIARPGAAGLVTASIEVESEVVGPILAITDETLNVMGQTVAIGAVKRAGWWRKGVHVAVSGLRRTDGVIVASLIERRPRGPARVAGLLERDEDGFWISNLKLLDADESLLGQRVIAIGRLARGGFAASRMVVDGPPADAGTVDQLSLETYARSEGAVLRLGSGLTVRNTAFASLLAFGQEIRAVLDARVETDGQLTLESIRLSSAGGEGGGGSGGGPGGGPGGAPGGPGSGLGGPAGGPGGLGGGPAGGPGGLGGGPGGGPGGGGPGGGGPGGGGPGGGGGGPGGGGGGPGR